MQVSIFVLTSWSCETVCDARLHAVTCKYACIELQWEGSWVAVLLRRETRTRENMGTMKLRKRVSIFFPPEQQINPHGA